MAKICDVIFTGASGTKYTFEVYAADTTFNDVSAVYVLTKRTIVNGQGSHTMLYIGESKKLGRRLSDHEKWSCVNPLGCNCVCILLVADEETRMAIEQDLRDGNSTPCNDQ